MEKKFRTKTGFCHVTEDQIILTRNGIIGSVSKTVVGNNIARMLIIYGVVSVGLFYFAYDSFLNDKMIEAVFFGLLASYLVYGSIGSLHNSAAPIINRNDIQAVRFIKGIPGLTRSRFEIDFNDQGKPKKRLILLPRSLSGGQEVSQEAIQIMRSENLLSC